MTLLITVFAAVIATAVWYTRPANDKLETKVLCFLFWGASLMWLVDAVFEYIDLKDEFFTPSVEDMVNDAFLGLAVVALALVIWIIRLLIVDPRGNFQKK